MSTEKLDSLYQVIAQGNPTQLREQCESVLLQLCDELATDSELQLQIIQKLHIYQASPQEAQGEIREALPQETREKTNEIEEAFLTMVFFQTLAGTLLCIDSFDDEKRTNLANFMVDAVLNHAEKSPPSLAMLPTLVRSHIGLNGIWVALYERLQGA